MKKYIFLSLLLLVNSTNCTKYDLASGSSDETVRIWNSKTGKCIKILKGHTNEVTSVAFSPDGKTVASGSEDETIKIWNIKTGKDKTLKNHKSPITSVAFSPDGKTVASGEDESTSDEDEYEDENEYISIKIWNIETGKCIKTLKDHIEKVTSVAFSPDGKTVASGSNDENIKIWDIETEEDKTLKGHKSPVTSVAFNPNSSKNWDLASGSQDSTIKIWNIETRKCIKTLKNQSIVWSIAFSPNGKTVASGSLDKTIKIWDIKTEKCIKTLKGHKNFVWSVAFSPDGKTIASGSGDKTIKIWDTETGKCIKTLKGHKNVVRSVAFRLGETEQEKWARQDLQERIEFIKNNPDVIAETITIKLQNKTMDIPIRLLSEDTPDTKILEALFINRRKKYDTLTNKGTPEAIKLKEKMVTILKELLSLKKKEKPYPKKQVIEIQNMLKKLEKKEY